MLDSETDDDGFEKAFAGIEVESAEEQQKPEAEEKPEEKVEEPEQKPEEKPEEVKTEDDEEKTEEDDKPEPTTEPKPEEKPVEEVQEEAPKPLTKEDVTSIISDLQNRERSSTKELDTVKQDVMNAYYPDGLSNVLIDKNSGKELRTPQDVVDASNGQMSVEEASQWLMNEQYKLDQDVKEIKDNIEKVAETTITFKRDAEQALTKYDALFKARPDLQKKVFDKLMENVQADTEKGVIIKAPDVMDHYDFYLQPYMEQFTQMQEKPQPAPEPAPQPKPSVEDRMDETGDGGLSEVNDPNDFAQQVKKELSKGL